MAGHLGRHDLPALVDDVLVVASELATNAVIHARTPFHVRLSLFDGVVLLLVQDLSTAGPHQALALEGDVSGRGLTLVDALCHEWGVSPFGDQGKSVWATFDLHGEDSDSFPVDAEAPREITSRWPEPG